MADTAQRNRNQSAFKYWLEKQCSPEDKAIREQTNATQSNIGGMDSFVYPAWFQATWDTKGMGTKQKQHLLHQWLIYRSRNYQVQFEAIGDNVKHKHEPNVNIKHVVLVVFVSGGLRGCILQATTTTGTASEIVVENSWEWMSSEAAPETHKNLF
jgi:hypothetical protein